MGAGRSTAILAQVRDVVESQHMDVETVCMLMQIDVFELLEAFEDRVSQYADQFGVNVDLVADLVDEPEEVDQDELDAIEALLREEGL